jgi:hypothetical protein
MREVLTVNPVLGWLEVVAGAQPSGRQTVMAPPPRGTAATA